MKAQLLQLIKGENDIYLFDFAPKNGIPTSFFMRHKGAQFIRLHWDQAKSLWIALDIFGREIRFDQAQFAKLASQHKIGYYGAKHTDSQRKAFHIEGRSRYGNDWTAKRAELVSAITFGITSSSKDLTSADMERLTSGIRRQAPQYKTAA